MGFHRLFVCSCHAGASSQVALLANLRKLSYPEAPPVSYNYDGRASLYFNDEYRPHPVEDPHAHSQGRGFEVVPAKPRLAISALSRRVGHVKAAVLGNSIDLPERVALAQRMREMSPNLAIVLLHLPNDKFAASACDVLVEDLSGPEALARAVQRALKKRQM